VSDFGAIYLRAGLERKASMTMLRHYAECPRSGYFYARDKGTAKTIELVRGAAAHAIFERATELMIEQGEPMIPPSLVKVIVGEILAELNVPWTEHDYVREIAYRWAGEWAIDPRSVIACETLLALDVAGWQVRGKVDFAESQDAGATVYVADYKTARAAPAFEDVARKRTSDGRWAAKSFQLVLYALLLAFGRPVRTVLHTCDSCEGNGFWGGDRTETKPCTQCGGSGTVRDEIVEPFALAPRAERFEVELIFPGIEDRDGRMLRRPLSLSRLELQEYRGSLESLVVALERSEREGDWPAIVSTPACAECPCRPECPIPVELRDHRGEINSYEQAAQAAAVLERRLAEDAELRSELRSWVRENGGELRYGRDRVWRFKLVESDRIANKSAMWVAIDRATDYGEAFVRGEHVQTVSSSNFVNEKLSDDELAVA
jgi:hypothetical protein